MVSFVLDVGGKIQSAFLPFLPSAADSRSVATVPDGWKESGGRPCSSVDRASDHGSGGCRFESCQGHLEREAIPIPIFGFLLLMRR